MPDIDLDAARAARLEAQGERGFKFAGRRFELPAELPYEAVLAAGELVTAQDNPAALEGFLRALMGDTEYATFRDMRPSMPDLNELSGHLFAEYGLAPTSQNGNNGDGGEAEGGASDAVPKSQASSQP